MPSIRQLIAVLEDTRRRLDVPDNDFTWSSWNDREHALQQIDGHLSTLRQGGIPNIAVLFAPTGPIQEVSINSGWGNEFLELATRYDQAMASDEDTCVCGTDPDAKLEKVEDLGTDYQLAEVSILRCPACGQRWLRYFYELEGFTGSQRWYQGAIPQDAEITVTNAKGTLEQMEWYFYGGSYYDGKSGRTSGLIHL